MKKRLCSILIMLAMCLQLLPAAYASGSGNSSADVAINETNFPDPGLRQYVADFWDRNSNNVLEAESELAAITEIHLNGERDGDPVLTDVSGLHLFPNLKTLSLENMNISAADFSKLSSLEELCLEDNGIRNIRLPESGKLLSVGISHEEFSLYQLSLSLTSQLQYLYLDDIHSGTALSECIQLNKFKNLTGLVIRNGGIRNAVIRNMPNLEMIDLVSNNLADLTLENLPKLETLNVADNPITNLDLREWPELELNIDILQSSTMEIKVPAEGVNLSRWWALYSTDDGFGYIKMHPENMEGGTISGQKLIFNDNSSRITFQITDPSGASSKSRNFVLEKATAPIVTEATVSIELEGGIWNNTSESTCSFRIPLCDGVGFLDPDMICFDKIQPLPDYTNGGLWSRQDNPEGTEFTYINDLWAIPITGDTKLIYQMLPETNLMLSEEKLLGGGLVKLTWTNDLDIPEIDSDLEVVSFGHNSPFITTLLLRVPDATKTYTFTVTLPGGESTLTRTLQVISTDDPNLFPDVKPGQWFYDPIHWAVKEDIVKGYPDQTFRPNAKCTRAHIVTFLWRAAGCPSPAGAVDSFPDIEKGRWYYEAVLWAAESGIATGFPDGTFRPDGLCTRAEAAQLIYRMCGSPSVNTAESPFPDELPAWAKDAILWTAQAGISKGFEDGTFRAGGNCTRAQIVTFIQRIP